MIPFAMQLSILDFTKKLQIPKLTKMRLMRCSASKWQRISSAAPVKLNPTITGETIVHFNLAAPEPSG